MARTHVFFFDEEETDELDKIYLKLKASAEERMPHIDTPTKVRMTARLQLLESAVLLLREPVD